MYKNANESEFALWWNTVIRDAELVDIRYKIKGFFVWMPYGFSLMKNIKNEWDTLFFENGIKETYFPLLVPEEYAKQNESWWDSFKEQAFYALGYSDNEKKVFLRPTGEPAMYPMFSLWIRSHRDLPLRIYETVSSFRNETKSTKVFVRDVEIGPWYEIHTCHKTKEEAEKEIELAIEMNDIIFDRLAVARLKVRKPKHDCFPGSVGAVEFYTMLNDKVVENSSCNNLGQAYAKAFNIKYSDENDKEQYVWQTCTGNGERYLAALIGNHSDEKGLVIPPEVAPVKAAVVLIGVDKKAVERIDFGLPRAQIEFSENVKSVGGIRFETEKMGVPIRIEIGKKELENGEASFAWRNGKKEFVDFSKIKESIDSGLKELQKELRDASEKELESRLKVCKTKDEAKEAKIAIIGWCGNIECSDWLQSDLGKELIGKKLEVEKMKCLHCGKDGEASYFSESY
jgi:prolyl-tRNA synthetase